LDQIHDEPEFAEDILLNDGANHVGVESTPEQIAIIARAEAEINAGNFFTTEQVLEHFSRRSSGWNLANQG
jgi:predicted transcriptional regulator